MRRILLSALILTASVAKANDQHMIAFGDRAWIADALKADYLVKVRGAGYNYEHVPVAYREHEIRTELAMAGCMTVRHLQSPERGPVRRKAIIRDCDATKRQWLIQLNVALRDSGGFPYAYAGQTVLAIIPMKTVHRVLRATIKHAGDTNRADVFRKLVVPLLLEACAVGSCGLADNHH